MMRLFTSQFLTLTGIGQVSRRRLNRRGLLSPLVPNVPETEIEVVMAPTRTQTTFPPTGAGLIAFIDHAMQRGLVRPGLGANYKTTCLEVLPLVLGPAWETADVLRYDVDDLLEEFQTGRGRRLPAAGLERYCERLAEALELFRPYAEDVHPAESEPIGPDDNRQDAPEHDDGDYNQYQAEHHLNGTGGSSVPNEATPPPASVPVPEQVERLTYPFPLRDGVIITVCLPVDLTSTESERLAKFIDSLAVTETKPAPSKRPRVVPSRSGATRSSRTRPDSPSRARNSTSVAAVRRARASGPT